MLLIRKIGKIFRGNATPTQLMLACIFGGMIGFLPEFSNSLGLTIFLLFCILILNSNIGVTLIVMGTGKLFSLLIIPISFKIGLFIIEKLATSVFSFLINSPVTAFFGFEYYLTTGQMFVGFIYGTIIGFILVKILKSFRNSMIKAEQTPTKILNYSKTWWGGFLLWLFFGKKSKEDYSNINKRKGSFIRISGVVFVVICLLIFLGTERFFTGSFIKNTIKNNLEQVNGATVDIKNVSINLSESKFYITGLAIADAENLQLNSFSADKILADISATDLLRKRLRLDNLEILKGEIGGKRDKVGKIIFSNNSPKPASQNENFNLKGDKIEDYLSNAQEIKSKLKKWKAIYEKYSSNVKNIGKFVAEDGESLEDRLIRKGKLLGFNNVKASHLIKGSPLFAISNLKADNVKVYKLLQDETLKISAKEISTNPYLSEIAPKIEIESSKKTFYCKGIFSGLSSKNGTNEIELKKNSIEADPILKNLKLKGEQTFKGGTISIITKGSIYEQKGVNIDFPLNVTIENTTMTIPKLGSKKVESLSFKVYLKGEMDNPNVKVDSKSILKQIKSIWKGVLKDKANEEKEKLKNKAKEKIKEKYGKTASDLLGGLLKKKKK